MISKNRVAGWLQALLMIAIVPGCGGGGEGAVLFVDAEFDPASASDHFIGLSEANIGVAQTFTVLADGKFEQFSIVVTDGVSLDTGVIRLTVRPLVGAVPDPSESSSIMIPIDVDTSTLPLTLDETFTIFDVGDDPGREVLEGQTYAIVVEFMRRSGIDTAPVARVYGQTGDPLPGETGAVDPGSGYVVNTNDYFFRTFSLQ